MATRRRIGAAEIPADAARRMYNQNRLAYTPPQIVIPKFDAVGLISITPRAIKEGITYDTVHVIMATPFGIRSLPLSDVLGQCSDVAIRQVFLPGEQPYRDEQVIPHPMPTIEDALREARAAKTTRDFVRTKDPIYGIPYPPQATQTTTVAQPTANAANGAAASNAGKSSMAFAAAMKAGAAGKAATGAPAKTKESAFELPPRNPISVLFSNTYSLPEPNVPLCPYNDQIHNAGAASKRRHMHMRVLYACLTAFDKLYSEKEVASLFAHAMIYVRKKMKIDLPKSDEIHDMVTIVEDYCARRAPMREEARAKAKEMVMQRIAAGEKDVKATVKRIERQLMDDDEDDEPWKRRNEEAPLTEEERIAKLEERNALRAAQHESNRDDEKEAAEQGPVYQANQLSYNDLAALMGVLCMHGHAVTMTKAEVIGLTSFFLDPKRAHPHITVREYMVAHLRALLRNASLTKQHQYFLSGAVLSHLLQVSGILPEDAEYYFEPKQFLQGNVDAVSHLHALMSREYILPKPTEEIFFDEQTLYRRERRRFLRSMVAEALTRRMAKREAYLQAIKAKEEEDKVKRAKEREERRREVEAEMARKLKKAEEEARLAEEEELRKEREAREAKEREDMERRKREKEEQKRRERLLNGEEDEDEEEEETDSDEEEHKAAETLKQEHQAMVAAAGEDRAVLITFSVSNLPSHLVESSQLSSFATTCAVWDAEAIDEQGQQCPTLVAYTPSIRGELSPDYQTACMLSYSSAAKNHFEVLICQCDDPQTLASAPVLCRATIDLTYILASFARTSQHVVYPLTDPQTGAEAGSLEVLVFSEAMTELVLFLGSDVAVFREDHGSVLCTYEGLQALLRASGDSLSVCQGALRELHDQQAQYSSMSELAAAVATHRSRQGCGDAVYSDAVRQSVYEALRTSGVVDVSYVSAAMVEPLIRAYGHVGATVLALWRMRGVKASNWSAFVSMALQNKERGGYPEGKSADSDSGAVVEWSDATMTEAKVLLSKVLVCSVTEPEIREVCAGLLSRIGGTTPLMWIFRALAKAKYTYQTLESLADALIAYI